MPSSLHSQAVNSLSGDEKDLLKSFAAWLTGSSGSSPAGGARILENLQEECHLVGDEAFGNPAELAAFLRRCVARLAAVAEANWYAVYDEVCQEFSGRGLRLARQQLPDDLLRYISSRTAAANLIERMLGKRARLAFDNDTFPPETLFARLGARWQASRLAPSDRLGREDWVFATFEHPGGAPRDDATALTQALALPILSRARTGTEIMMEFAYPTDEVDNHRFPTVADARWFHSFRPAREEAPEDGRPETCCGWTEPLGGHSAQPEILHTNASLRVLSGPPRLVGPIL